MVSYPFELKEFGHRIGYYLFKGYNIPYMCLVYDDSHFSFYDVCINMNKHKIIFKIPEKYYLDMYRFKSLNTFSCEIARLISHGINI
jgi:hypothetical protein